MRTLVPKVVWANGKRFAVIGYRASLRSQRLHRIHTGGTARGNESSDQRGQSKKQRSP